MSKPRILQQLDGELSTDIILNADPDQNMEAVTKQYVDNMNNNLLSKTNDSGNNITLTNANITLTADPTANMQAATKQYVDNNGGTFQAIHGTTTYEEIVEAYNQGKIITLYHNDYSDYIFDLTTIPKNSNLLYFRHRNYSNFSYATTYNYYCTIDSSSSWSPIYVTLPSQVTTSLYRNGQTDLSSSIGYYRPIRVSTSAPTASDGNIGDIWIQYST